MYLNSKYLNTVLSSLLPSSVKDMQRCPDIHSLALLNSICQFKPEGSVSLFVPLCQHNKKKKRKGFLMPFQDANPRVSVRCVAVQATKMLSFRTYVVQGCYEPPWCLFLFDPDEGQVTQGPTSTLICQPSCMSLFSSLLPEEASTLGVCLQGKWHSPLSQQSRLLTQRQSQHPGDVYR